MQGRGLPLSEQSNSLSAFHNIRIVLVNTSHPGNIGATARAMKNMGLSKLTLVDPEQVPSPVATGRAVAAVDILERAKVVPTLEDAVRDCGLVIGASARVRRIPWPLLTPMETAVKVAENIPAISIAGVAWLSPKLNFYRVVNR